MFSYKVFRFPISRTTGMSNSRGYVERIGEILAWNFAAGCNLVTKEIEG